MPPHRRGADPEALRDLLTRHARPQEHHHFVLAGREAARPQFLLSAKGDRCDPGDQSRGEGEMALRDILEVVSQTIRSDVVNEVTGRAGSERGQDVMRVSRLADDYHSRPGGD